MKKYFLLVPVFCLLFLHAFAQQRKPAAFLLTQYSKTIYDQTKGNNPWGVGIALQALLNKQARLTPMIELSVNTFVGDDELSRTNGDSVWPLTYKAIPGMRTALIGYAFYPTSGISLSLTAGPSFVNGATLWAIKPSLDFYFLKKWMGKLSYLNVFDREKITKNDFGSCSLAIGYRLL